MPDDSFDANITRRHDGEAQRVTVAVPANQTVTQPGETPLGTISAARRIRKGDTDELGGTVSDVFIGTDHFIIYAAVNGAGDNGRLRYVLPDDYDSARQLRRRLAPVAGELAFVSDVLAGMRGTELWPGGSSRTGALRTRTLDLMARAMQMAFEQEPGTARVLLERSREEVTNCRDSRNRMRYIFANAMALLLLLGVWFVDWSRLGLPGVHAFFTAGPPLEGTPPIRVVDILALGALGAFFSVSAAINSVRVSHSISIQEMLYAGFVRVPIGVIAAGVTILLISGDWILGAISPESRYWSYFLFGFLAGFSELFVPNALKQVETATPVRIPPHVEGDPAR